MLARSFLGKAKHAGVKRQGTATSGTCMADSCYSSVDDKDLRHTKDERRRLRPRLDREAGQREPTGALREFADRQGWAISMEFVDTVSGSGKETRPQFERMLLAASQGKFDLPMRARICAGFELCDQLQSG